MNRHHFRHNALIMSCLAAGCACVVAYALLAHFTKVDAASAAQPTGSTPAFTDWDLKIIPLQSQDDFGQADLVLFVAGKQQATWPLGSTWNWGWRDVQVHRIAASASPVWWTSWGCGGGSGLSQSNGAVVWITKDQPHFWKGTWSRTEYFSHPEQGYEYGYDTQVLPRPDGGLVLLVSIEYMIPEGRKFNCENIVCEPLQLKDGKWDIRARRSSEDAIKRLLAVKCLSGVHDQLRAFLPQESIRVH